MRPSHSSLESAKVRAAALQHRMMTKAQQRRSRKKMQKKVDFALHDLVW